MENSIDFKISPDVYESVFVLPSCIVDKYLKVAGKAHLKVLLWIFKNSPKSFDRSVVSRDTGVSTDEIDDIILYWENEGILQPSESSVFTAEEKSNCIAVQAQEQQSQSQKPEESTHFERENLPPIKPTQAQIAEMLNTDSNFRYMFGQIETLIGPFGYDKQAKIVQLYSYYGLPGDVILTLFEYAKFQKKEKNIEYIMRLGKRWADNGIDTLEKAQREIDILDSTSTVWNELKISTGIDNPKPTPKQLQFLTIWVTEYHFGSDMIILAYNRTAEKTAKISFSYMNGILKSWFEAGYKTPLDVQKADEEFRQKRSVSSREQKTKSTSSSTKKSFATGNSSPPSYDLDAAIQEGFEDLDPTKTKRGT